MARRVLGGAIPKRVLVAVVCAMALACLQSPDVLAQRGTHSGGAHGGAGHVGGGARVAAPHIATPHIAAPVTTRGTFARPRGIITPGPRGVGASTLRVGVGPISGLRGFGGFRRRPFFGRRFFAFGPGIAFNSFLWGCSPFWGWTYGCNALPIYPSSYGSGFENYVTVPSYESTAYVYGAEGRDLVWLYLKDGSVYAVTDYWFVNGDVHFNAVGEGGVQSAEQVIGLDELDAQKTSDVNTARGFRVVMRDEPWQKYLKNHPDSTPPPLVPERKD